MEHGNQNENFASRLLEPSTQKTSVDDQLVYRCTLELFQSDDAKFPDFNYTTITKPMVTATTEKDEYFSDSEDISLKIFAKKFEEKYGPSKEKKTKNTDYVDIGYGYDESDPFLDNSEAYDEIVPSDWTTEHGGFYINQGNLDYKPLSPMSPNDRIQFKSGLSNGKKKHKRIIPKELSTQKKKKQFLNKEKQRKKQAALNKAQKILFKKKKQNVSTVKDEDSCGVPLAQICKSFEDDLPLAKILKVDNTKKINVLNKDTKQKVASSGSECTSKDNVNVPASLNSETVQAASKIVKVEVPLPENLNEEFLDDIKKLKVFASLHTKGKFFTSDVNEVLSKFARACRMLSPKVRNGVYDHTLFYLPCSKDTLVKRCRALVVQHQRDLEGEPMQMLIEAINKIMLEQKREYDNEVANALQEKAREQIKQTGLNSFKADEDQEEKSKKNFPKKKFVWTNDVRKSLCDVVKVRVDLLKISKSKSISAEEYIKEFLETEVRKLWPKGWMTSRILYKESRSAHHCITQPLCKSKKIKTELAIPASSAVSLSPTHAGVIKSPTSVLTPSQNVLHTVRLPSSTVMQISCIQSSTSIVSSPILHPATRLFHSAAVRPEVNSKKHSPQPVPASHIKVFTQPASIGYAPKFIATMSNPNRQKTDMSFPQRFPTSVFETTASSKYHHDGPQQLVSNLPSNIAISVRENISFKNKHVSPSKLMTSSALSHLTLPPVTHIERIFVQNDFATNKQQNRKVSVLNPQPMKNAAMSKGVNQKNIVNPKSWQQTESDLLRMSKVVSSNSHNVQNVSSSQLWNQNSPFSYGSPNTMNIGNFDKRYIPSMKMPPGNHKPQSISTDIYAHNKELSALHKPLHDLSTTQHIAATVQHSPNQNAARHGLRHPLHFPANGHQTSFYPAQRLRLPTPQQESYQRLSVEEKVALIKKDFLNSTSSQGSMFR